MHALKLIQGQYVMCKATVSRTNMLVTVPVGRQRSSEQGGRNLLVSRLKVFKVLLSTVKLLRRGPQRSWPQAATFTPAKLPHL